MRMRCPPQLGMQTGEAVGMATGRQIASLLKPGMMNVDPRGHGLVINEGMPYCLFGRHMVTLVRGLSNAEENLPLSYFPSIQFTKKNPFLSNETMLIINDLALVFC